MATTWLALAVVIIMLLVADSSEEVESVEHLWLRCPALLVKRHHSDLEHTMDERVRLSRAALALLRTIFRRLRKQQQQQQQQQRSQQFDILRLETVDTNTQCYVAINNVIIIQLIYHSGSILFSVITKNCVIDLKHINCKKYKVRKTTFV